MYPQNLAQTNSSRENHRSAGIIQKATSPLHLPTPLARKLSIITSISQLIFSFERRDTLEPPDHADTPSVTKYMCSCKESLSQLQAFPASSYINYRGKDWIVYQNIYYTNFLLIVVEN